MREFLYGGLSVTFKKHNNQNLKLMQKSKKAADLSVSEREIFKRYSLVLRRERDQFQGRNTT